MCSKCHHEIHKKIRVKNNLYKPKKVYIKKGYSHTPKMKPYKKPIYYNDAKRLREEGKTYKEIGEILNISKSQIYKWLNNTPYN